MEHVKRMYIDGEWILSSTGETRTISNPATGESIAVVTEGGSADAARAVEAARAAFEEDGQWRSMSATQRGQLLCKVADLLESRVDEIGRTECLNTGKLYRETRYDDAYAAIGAFRYHGGVVTELQGRTANHVKDLMALSIREPIGVCGLIIPWNFPIGTGAGMIAPALAAGNTIVVKPSSITPLTAVLLFEVLEEAGFPKGVVNLVLGAGNCVGQELVTSEGVDMISFTGGTDTGKKLIRDSADTLKKLSLELGGKSAVVVFDDADIDLAVDNVMFGIFLSQGQVCVAGSRLLVQEKIYDTVVERLTRRVGRIKIGMPFDECAEFGPLVSEAHMKKVLSHIEEGIQEGAKLAIGGKRMTQGEFAKGYFVEPTVFVDCENQMNIVQNEVFGPVLTVQKFSDEKEAIAMANSTVYGLAGAVFTADMGRGLRVCKSIKTGVMWVNTYLEGAPGLGFTPYKQSGMGAAIGMLGMEQYTVLKKINIQLDPKKVAWFAE